MKRAMLVGAVLAATWAGAVGEGEEKKPEPQVVAGEVVALTAYMIKGQHGAEGATEAEAAVRGGAPAGLLREDGSVLLILVAAPEGGEALKYVAHRVEITGIVHDRGGMRAIVPQAVKDLGAVPPAPAPEPK